MKLGDLVTAKVSGKDMQFCILGFYTKRDTGEKIAILAYVDINFLLEASIDELMPLSVRELLDLSNSHFIN